MNRIHYILIVISTLVLISFILFNVLYFYKLNKEDEIPFDEFIHNFVPIEQEEHVELIPIFSINVNSFHDILGSSNWNITWSGVSSSIDYVNSWIGVYFYGQRVTSKGNLFFRVFSADGKKFLKIPKEAGIYDIRYVHEHNFQVIASTGPLFVNPTDVKVEVKQTRLNLGDKITVLWNFAGISDNKLTSSTIYLCLNILGSYEKCLWEKSIVEDGEILINGQNNTGYYVMRLLNVTNTNVTECIAVSHIFRISDPKYTFKLDSVNPVVASSLKANWNTSYPLKNDSIKLYSIENGTYNFNDSIQYVDVTESSGEFYLRLIPNSKAGPYVFVYFSDLVAVAVSDIIDVQQPKVTCSKNKTTKSKIKHLVIIVTENHSFDSYFGSYCLSPVNSNYTCNSGPRCCEKIPESLDGYLPYTLDDMQNINFDPIHLHDCELCEVNGGKMNNFIIGCYCSHPQNFAVADPLTLLPLHDLARKYALADKYFQPVLGSSLSNNMFFAKAGYVFKDNSKKPYGNIGINCYNPNSTITYHDPSITSLLLKCDYILKVYAEGYKTAFNDPQSNKCYPIGYDASDIPYAYFYGINDNKNHLTDYSDLIEDIQKGILPDVSFVKPIGIKSGHPGLSNISDEINFSKQTIKTIMDSKYANDTLILWLPDESGGYYDHVPPPETSKVDNVPYGPRVPLLAIGKFAKKNYISHVVMEHSSIVKFIEWNWFEGRTGQLNLRDKYVNNIGDLIDPLEAGIEVPSN